MKKFASSPIFRLLPDKTALKIQYRNVFLKKLDLKNPQTFNEKLQWLKLYNRRPEYTKMVDKYEAKKYVASLIGEEHIIPTLGVYDSFDEIDFDALPDQFVLKCTHGSGDVVICRDKQTFDKDSAGAKLTKALKTDYYKIGREWPYKNVPHRIIAEPYMEDDKTKELPDYKVYCLNGRCEYVMTCIGRFNGGTKFLYFDRRWNLVKEFSNHGMQYGDSLNVDKPAQLEKMFEFAEVLSRHLPFVRADFYICNNQLYFGELTFFPSSGFDVKRRPELQEYLDNNLRIKEI